MRRTDVLAGALALIVLALALFPAALGARVQVRPAFPGPPTCDQIAPATPIAGAQVATEQATPVCLTGTVTVHFAGSRPARCQTRGVCGYSGTISWEPLNGELTTAVAGGAHHHPEAAFTFDGGPLGPPEAKVVTTRTGAGGVRGTCRSSAVPAGGATRLRGGEIIVQVPIEGVDGLLSPCAGPVTRSLPPSPTFSLPLNAVRAGTASTTVDESQPFSADGFAGEVVADLQIVTGTPTVGHPSASGGMSNGKVVREREVDVDYRFSVRRGAITGSWSHLRRHCAPIDACGLQGRARLSVGGHGTLELSANGPLHRPRRDFLTAIGVTTGGDQHGITPGDAEAHLTTRSTISIATRQGASRCTAAFRLRDATLVAARYQRFVDAPVPAHRSPKLAPGAVSYRLSVNPAGVFGEPLRTSCPGPGIAHGLIEGVLTSGDLQARSATVELDRPQRWRDDGYRLRFAGAATLRLTRTAITSSRVTFEEFPVSSPGAVTGAGQERPR